MKNTKVSPPNILILAGGTLMFLGSFLDFYTVPGFASFSAWSNGLFGIATVVVFCGVAMAVQVGMATFANGVNMPRALFGLTWNQIHLALGLQAMIMMVAFFFQDHRGADFGIGFWCMFASAIALLVGAIMRIAAANTGLRGV